MIPIHNCVTELLASTPLQLMAPRRHLLPPSALFLVVFYLLQVVVASLRYQMNCATGAVCSWSDSSQWTPQGHPDQDDSVIVNIASGASVQVDVEVNVNNATYNIL